MIVGIILAGDGTVEATVEFATHEEAWTMMNNLLNEYYDPEYDRVLVTETMTYQATVDDLDESIAQDKAEYYAQMANDNPQGYIAGQEPWNR